MKLTYTDLKISIYINSITDVKQIFGYFEHTIKSHFFSNLIVKQFFWRLCISLL